MNSKTNFFYRFRYFSAYSFLIFLVVIVIVTISIICIRQNRPTNEENQPKISLRGLLTLENAVRRNVCRADGTIDDCVLIYNAKILMKTLVLMNDTESSLPPLLNATVDCKTLKIRRNQLSQIFDLPFVSFDFFIIARLIEICFQNSANALQTFRCFVFIGEFVGRTND